MKDENVNEIKVAQQSGPQAPAGERADSGQHSSRRREQTEAPDVVKIKMIEQRRQQKKGSRQPKKATRKEGDALSVIRESPIANPQSRRDRYKV